MRWFRAVLIGAFVVVALVASPSGGGNVAEAAVHTVNAGHDLLETDSATTSIDLAIPADFFAPGSDPLSTTVPLDGVPFDGFAGHNGLTPTDTIVQRLQDAGATGFPDTVPIEIVALQLKSAAPITVTYNGGQFPEPWDIDIQIPEGDLNQTQGSITLQHEYPDGGTFSSTLPVNPLLTFTRDPGPVTVGPMYFSDLTGQVIILDTAGPWCHEANPLDNPGNDWVIEIPGLTSNFFPGIVCPDSPHGPPVVFGERTKTVVVAEDLTQGVFHGVRSAEIQDAQVPLFSVRGPTDIIIPGCEPAALLTLPGVETPCPRAAPAPDLVITPPFIGLDVFGGVGTDDLDAFSMSEPGGLGAADLHFSVDTTAVGLACPAPDVSAEAAAGEAHGDIFSSPLTGCNSRFQDEIIQGLNAPGAPADDMDALAEPVLGGPCVDPTLTSIPCPVFSVAAGSAITLAASDPLGTPITLSSLLVPPSTPMTGVMAAACPGGGLPCVAVLPLSLGLDIVGGFASDDLDALCWFDLDSNGLPGLPRVAGGPDDYLFSLAPGSASLVSIPAVPADILAPGVGAPVLAYTAASLGLDAAFADNLDAMKCLGDFGMGVCPTMPWPTPAGDSDCDGFTDTEEAFVGTDAADPCPDDQNDDAWPADMVGASGYGTHDKTVNILDIVQLTPPTFGVSPPDPLYLVRKDFNGDSVINILDIVRLTPPMFGQSCT